MYYIKNGMGKNWSWLAVLFSMLGALVVFVVGFVFAVRAELESQFVSALPVLNVLFLPEPLRVIRVKFVDSQSYPHPSSSSVSSFSVNVEDVYSSSFFIMSSLMYCLCSVCGSMRGSVCGSVCGLIRGPRLDFSD